MPVSQLVPSDRSGAGGGRRSARRAPAFVMTLGVLGAAVAPLVTFAVPAHAQGTCTTVGSTTTCVFDTVGEHAFAVPAGVTSVSVTAIGGRGGRSTAEGNIGGRGAQVSGSLTNLTPSQTLYVEVGGNANAVGASCAGAGECVGGFNGGGSVFVLSGGGGGASDVRTMPRSTPLSTVDSRLVVAAGGGGAGVGQAPCAVSAGGDAGSAGADGDCGGGTGGQPGTATAGGAGGSGVVDGQAGQLGGGGGGGGSDGRLGGAGGGGLYGGGQGGTFNADNSPVGSAGGGGGGSSLVPAGGTGPVLTDAPPSITIRYSTAPATPPSCATVTSANPQGYNIITGTNGSNLLAGTAGPDAIFGLGGNDVLTGLGGNDLLCGGDGNDSINGGAGNDRLEGQNGNDVLDGGAGTNQNNGGPGLDLCLRPTSGTQCNP